MTHPSQNLTDLPPNLLQIGEVAKQASVTLRTLRYYEEINLIEPHHRSKGNFRLYHPGVVKRIEFIHSLKRLDFSLDDIRDLLGPTEDWSTDERVIARSIDALQAKEKKIKEKVAELQIMAQDVAEALKMLEETCITCKEENPTPCDIECEHKKYHLG